MADVSNSSLWRPNTFEQANRGSSRALFAGFAFASLATTIGVLTLIFETVEFFQEVSVLAIF